MELTERQKEILAVTQDMFAELGYQETSMRLIASRLNIKAASLYSHFESKDHILKIILDQFYGGAEKIIKELQLVTDPKDRFYLFIKKYVSLILSLGLSFEIYQKYYQTVDEKFDMRYSALNFRLFEFVRSLYLQVFPDFVEKSLYYPDSTVLFLIGTLNNVPKYVNLEQFDIEEISRDIFERWMYGFRKDMNPDYITNFHNQ